VGKKTIPRQEEEPGDEDWDRLDGQSEDEELGEMVNVVCGMCDEKDDDRQGDHEPVAERKPEPDVVPVEEPKDPVAEPETVPHLCLIVFPPKCWLRVKAVKGL